MNLRSFCLGASGTAVIGRKSKQEFTPSSTKSVGSNILNCHGEILNLGFQSRQFS